MLATIDGNNLTNKVKFSDIFKHTNCPMGPRSLRSCMKFPEKQLFSSASKATHAMEITVPLQIRLPDCLQRKNE